MDAKIAPLILASASPRRRALLKTLGIPFRTIPSRCDESSSEKRPEKRVRELALRKARAVARGRSSGVVLGADTLVVLGSQILGKPKDANDAYRMLYRLCGSTHRVLTGVALVNAATGQEVCGHAVSRVRMKKLDLDTLLHLSMRHLDKAGSYAIQEKKDPIATVIQGSYDNVVGLPLQVVKDLLKKISRKPA